jgi:hypothetical protein
VQATNKVRRGAPRVMREGLEVSYPVDADNRLASC